jgi:tetratricopeptide (TPR) repeat protein
MRQVFTIVVLTVLTAAGIGCSRNSAANAEVAANTNTNTVTEPSFADIADANTTIAEGNRLMDENQTQSAIEAYKQAIKLSPDLPEPHFRLGIAYALLELQYQQSGTIDPDNPDARVKTRSQKAFEKAVETYKKWLKANPKDDMAHYNLARTYNKVDKIDEAEEEFREAVKLKPDDADYQTELGGVLVKLAQYHEAIVALKKVIELDPANERAATLLEDAEAGQKRLDYLSPKTDDNRSTSATKHVRANSTANTSIGSNSNSNSAPKPPPANTTKPKNPPKFQKDGTVDKRPRFANRPN